MAELWQTHTVVFDLDDTLFRERDYVLSGFSAAGRWLQRAHGVDGLAGEATRLFTAGARGKVFDQALGRLGRGDLVALVPALVDVYRNHAPRIELTADALEVLDWAKPQFQLALVSDGYLEVQERKAAALGLNRWIEHLVFSDRWGREAWKPNERPFREVMARLPGDDRGYVYISDNPHKDFIAPRQLGWRTLRLRRAGGEHAGYEPTETEAAEREIYTLQEVKTVLAPWPSR